MINYNAPYKSSQLEKLKNDTEAISMVQMAKPIFTVMVGGDDNPFETIELDWNSR